MQLRCILSLTSCQGVLCLLTYHADRHGQRKNIYNKLTSTRQYRSSLDNLCKSVDLQLTSKVNDPSQPKLQSKQLLKRQLQSLKASLLNLGQKEHFLEGAMLHACQRCSMQHA